MNTLDDFRIQSFLEYQDKNGFEQAYIHDIKHDLNEFKIECQRLNISMDKVTPIIAKGFQQGLVWRGLMPRTVNKRIYILRVFYSWLVREEIIAANPFFYVLSLQVRKNEPNFVPLDQVKDFFSDLDDRTVSDKSMHLMAIFECLYGGGIKLRELCCLRSEDFLSETDSILIRATRTRPQRQVPLPFRSATALRKYIAYRVVRFPHAKYLIVNQSGTQLTRQLVYNLLTSSKMKAPIAFKNSYRVHLLQSGASIKNLADLTKTTIGSLVQFDVKTYPTNLKSIHNKCHPRSNGMES